MTKEILGKISKSRGTLDVHDLTPDEKKQLYAFMQEHGATPSMSYDRFFKEGFDEWELRGIDDIKREFCDRNFLNALRDVGEGFYSALPNMKGMKVQLVNLMAEYGMEHRLTVQKRFDNDDWKQWERRGVRDLFRQFIMSNQH